MTRNGLLVADFGRHANTRVGLPGFSEEPAAQGVCLILSIKEATRELCCSRTSLWWPILPTLGHQVCLATACLAESATKVLFSSAKSDMIRSSSMSSDQQTLICRKLASGRTESFPFGIIPLFVVSEAEVVIRVIIGCLCCLGVGDFGHQNCAHSEVLNICL